MRPQPFCRDDRFAVMGWREERAMAAENARVARVKKETKDARE